MEQAKNILLSFVDLKDPFVPTGVDGESESGPVLSMLAARPFDEAVLFHTPHSEEIAEATLTACRERHPECAVTLARLAVSDPKDYSQIMGGLGRELVRLRVAANHEANSYWVCVSSGTAEMRAAWFLLTSSGLLSAKLLQLGSPAEPLFGPANVKEVDLGSSPWRDLRDLVMPQAYFELESDTLRESTSLPERMAPVRAARRPRFSPGEFFSLEQPEEEEPEPTPALDEALAELGIHVGSAVTRVLMERAAVVADTSVTVLVMGETGTGKELVARLIHRLSARRDKPFVAVNCATLQDLAESRLFGHKKGSFTGADKDHRGFFQQAHGGTLFLDEVGELPLAAQASLLRALQENTVQPLGSSQELKVDVRVIAATNRNLKDESAAGRFREDLYYRLVVVVLQATPLRERREEIVPLAIRMIDASTQRLAKRRSLSKSALKRLTAHDWPGNVRELGNVIERSVLFSTNAVLEAEDLLLEGMSTQGGDGLSGLPEPAEGFSLEKYLDQVRRQLILRALSASGGNQAQAAKLLGVSKQAVNAFQKGLNDKAD